MKLNPDCIRDILLTVEGETSLTQRFDFNVGMTPGDGNPLLMAYDDETIVYHIDQCYQEQFLSECKHYVDGSWMIQGLTPAGHSFLDSVRPPDIWDKTRSTAAKSGIVALGMLRDIAVRVAAEAAKGRLPGM